MGFDTLRVYDAGLLYDVGLPDWYHEADRLSNEEGLSGHQAFTRVLGCGGVPLTDDGCEGGWIEVRFWPSARVGMFVLIETPLAFVEQIVVPNPADWLPFLSRYLAPLLVASNQSALIALHGKIGNAFIAWARHGKGSHVDRETGLSRIDLDNDRDRRRAEQARLAMARAEKAGRT